MKTGGLKVWLEECGFTPQADEDVSIDDRPVQTFQTIDAAVAFARNHRETGFDLVLSYPPSGRLRVPLFGCHLSIG